MNIVSELGCCIVYKCTYLCISRCFASCIMNSNYKVTEIVGVAEKVNK